MVRSRINAVNLALSLVPFVVFALLWEVAAWSSGSARCPGLGLTLTTLCASILHDPIIEAQGGGANGFLPHVLATLSAFISGFGVGAIAGTILAVLMFQSKKAMFVIEPILEFLRALPPLLVVPFAIVLFQASNSLEILTVILYSAFSTCVYALNSLRDLNPNYSRLASMLGANRWQAVATVQLPGLLPELLGGLRVTAALGLGIAVVTEYLATPNGLGRIMKYAMSFSRVDLIFVAIIWVVCIALAVDAAIAFASRFALGYRCAHQIWKESDNTLL